MLIDNWLRQVTKKLETAGIGTARLDCLVLLEDELRKDRAWILAHPEFEVDDKILNKLSILLERRVKHEPLAYIRGFTEFYGRKFFINKDVLEPRPESETMIELLKKLDLTDEPTIADIGTGSGALAITAKLELPVAEIIAVDIDSKCLEVARKNAASHKVKIGFFEGDLLKPLPSSVDVILANLPYVPKDIRLNQSAEMEPKLAIAGGGDGLEIYRRFFEQVQSLKAKPKFIITESLAPQHKGLEAIASTAGYVLQKTDDLIQLFRFGD